MLVDVRWLNRREVTGNMTSEMSLVDGWGVESVIVTWGKVDNHVVEFITLRFD